MEFLLQWSIVMGIFIITYEMAFKNLAYFKFNRAYLVSFPLLAALIVSINIPQQTIIPTYELDAIDISGLAFEGVQQKTWFNTLQIIYLAGAFVSFLFFGFKLIGIQRLIRETQLNQNSNIGSFSFARFIHLKADLSQEQKKIVALHEEAHVQRNHTIDILFYEFLCCIHWFNPLVWMAKKKVAEVHEYEADEIASNQTINYEETLLSQVFCVNNFQMAHTFYNSLIEKRLIMMTKKKSNKSIWKYFLILPMLFLTFTLTSMMQDGGDDTKVYEEVDVLPEFEGGKDGLWNFISNNLEYPKLPEERQVDGKVIIQFVIDEQGKVTNITVEQSLYGPYDKSAIHVMTKMPNWKPGEIDGQPVKVSLKLPFNFRRE